MTDIETTKESRLTPFWATPQYGGGVMQGIGIACASLFLLNEVSADYFNRFASEVAVIGVILIVVGGIRARKVAQ